MEVLGFDLRNEAHLRTLTDERLFAWHAALFPTGRSGMLKINAGAWHDDSDGPMQVVSGSMGRETAHYNDRQIKVMNKLLDGFEGKLTSSKWGKIAKCSQDTATRDIKDLIKRGALMQDEGGGRSTSYSLVEQ